jgi:hypothetical protein
MSDFMESAKNFVNAAVSRTSWEAQKQLRLRGKQTEIDKLMEQRMQLLNELGLVAMNLYQQGKLTDTQLSRLCASIFELDHDVKSHESQLQDIRNEPYPADQFAAQPTPDYTPPPVTPNPPPPFSAQPNAGAAPRQGASPQGQGICPNCGSPIRSNALYCRTCGAKQR